MRAIQVGLAGLVAAVIALAPADLQGQGHGNARGHDKHAGGPPGQVKKQDDSNQVIIIGDDDDGAIVIRGDRGDDRRDRRQDGQIILRDDDGRVIVIGRDGIDERFRANRGRGPKFCRTGAGHPVFGRRWCVEKGFGLGDRDDVWRFPLAASGR